MGMHRAVRAGALAMVSCLAVVGCAADAPDGTAPLETVACPPSPSGDAGDAGVVTPEQLCVRDGRPWHESAYTFIVDTPDWASSPECDEARKDAFWGAWSHVQENIQTIDLGIAADPDRLEASVGIAVIDDRADGVADDPLAALDAEVAVCSPSDPTWFVVSHEGWNGVRDSASRAEAGVSSTWWTDAGDRWVVVQTFVANGVTTAEAQDAEDAIRALLDAQAAALDA